MFKTSYFMIMKMRLISHTDGDIDTGVVGAERSSAMQFPRMGNSGVPARFPS